MLMNAPTHTRTASSARSKQSRLRFRSGLKLGWRLLPLVLSLGGLLTAATAVSAAGNAPPLMLAKVYHSGVVLKDYWVSEKYDGVRGYWDGEKLITRGGERIAAPAWFVAGWPAVPMDGELWAGRGQFQKALSIVRQQTPDDAAWRGIRFMVFDLPAQKGSFTDRLPELRAVVQKIDKPWVQEVTQFKVASHLALAKLLTETVKAGGEGLMLHRGASLYQGVRNDDLLKVKPHEDTEARVLEHVPGQGKYAGMLGALLVEMPGENGRPGKRFKLGAGLSDEQRREPPAIGSTVSYRYRGFNDSGLPRFATFLRVRDAVER
jgi:DNA ligase-1